ncbi:hypothetical protein MLP_34050 [Microlunatus phosphovorus NM-1]|uniref:DUF2252 domain-containing protein n=1 Tax=Microlunatus phosphovorus (strain ATCC 700054 / DSM 10555 / JCM 9379 / NBRC 101784 / NCIMB 13414 / VKM Ac-1990 / NM-1) TaxID=1032480 RepID=F5XMG2_MICPN|nr:DUF2252 domain-containing protein [Microlunatus phosphovorus]BAK36419.1 hypothetical protein MLP_34050 [Microlunatus phosphovorus NM-1]
MSVGTVDGAAAARPAGRTMAHLTPEERTARGKAARNEVPRSSHGRWVPADHRPDPVALLEQQAATRVPELVPIRYGRMLVSPFTFYRGAALIMAADLAATARSGLNVQVCGDAHLSNFGVFASPERQLMFDINDFDETLPGPWEWDVKRLGASFEIAGRDRGFSEAQRREIVLAGAAEYRVRMRQAAEMRNLELWYTHVEVTQLFEQMKADLSRKHLAKAKATVAKARTRDSMQAFAKLTHDLDGERRITSDPPLVVPIEELLPERRQRDEVEAEIRGLIRSYRRTLETDRRHLLEEFELVHLARKVVGVGSVGTRAWILLLRGRDDQDPLFLQAKEAQESVLERFVGKSRYQNHGQRVVAGQRLMQAASDIFLGWQRVNGLDGQVRDFYVRQLRDWKGSADVDNMAPAVMTAYSRVCGSTLARAHARSGDRIAIAAYLGNGDVFDRAIADFSAAYADQNERDYQALRAAVDSGRVTARTGL